MQKIPDLSGTHLQAGKFVVFQSDSPVNNGAKVAKFIGRMKSLPKIDA